MQAEVHDEIVDCVSVSPCDRALLSEPMEAGWYYAQGDPPGTVRYWDGELWQGEPILQPGATPMPAFAVYPSYPENSRATTALVLGILGLVVCGLCAPFAWQIGNEELRAIDAGRRDPSNRGTAQAGRILGIVGTALIAIGILFLLVFGLAAVSI